MKKKVLSILLVFCLIMILGACSNNSPDVGEGEENSEEYMEEDSNVSEDASSDDLYLLAWEPNDTNSEEFFLLRDGQNYSLDRIDDDKAEGTLPVISHVANAAGHGGCGLYGEKMVTGNVPEAAREGFFSYGNVPVPVYEDGDKIVSYSSKGVPDLELRKVNFYGYAVRIVSFANGYKIVDDATGAVSMPLENTEVKTSSGEVVDDFYNLNEGEVYTISWYEGTQYKETTLPADSKYYVPEKGRLEDPDYVIEGALTKDGYAEYDISGVAPGIYRVINGSDWVGDGLIEIR